MTTYRERHQYALAQSNTLDSMLYHSFIEQKRSAIFALLHDEDMTNKIISRAIEDSLDDKSFLFSFDGVADFYITLLRVRFPAESILLPLDKRHEAIKLFSRKGKMSLVTRIQMLPRNISQHSMR